ncbi:hypothetical protein B0T16DRAFT_396682 [Cercophora newfieldiana]|uniref:Uncharacterized protein n=1 Tax=Cercophora newfieldiana TaxID=92897 RepID=A0AA39YPD4_9PEZI|nr:hypothetical protein B0T16DRAFT_396682 [Cercophora newfieldiana]
MAVSASCQLPANIKLSPSASPCPAGARTPEPSSINGILRQNKRDRLFVCPLQWTSQHLLLLGCQFRKTARWKSKTKNAGSRAPDDALSEPITCAVDDLLHAYSSEIKTSSVRHLLQIHDIHHSNSDLSFRFAQCVVATLQTDGVFSFSDAQTLAYLDLGAIASRRSMTIRMPRSQAVLNPPVARLQQIRTRQLQPTNEVEDPYIAAVLIALAQERRYGQTVTTPEYKLYLRQMHELHRAAFISTQPLSPERSLIVSIIPPEISPVAQFLLLIAVFRLSRLGR